MDMAQARKRKVKCIEHIGPVICDACRWLNRRGTFADVSG